MGLPRGSASFHLECAAFADRPGEWRATVYHGLPEDLYRPGGEPGEYLAFLGRISPEKREFRLARPA